MHDMQEQIKEGKHMKALKRRYSLLNLDNDNKAEREKLIDYFNTHIGSVKDFRLHIWSVTC